MNLLAESFVSSHVFDGLVGRSGERGKVIPGLAHAWEIDGSRTAWTFHLRKEVLFHHGKVLTAEDVVYSFERMMSTSQRMLYSYIVKEIQEVQALNASTVRILLKKPNEALPSLPLHQPGGNCAPRSGIHWRESVWTQACGHRSVQGRRDE